MIINTILKLANVLSYSIQVTTQHLLLATLTLLLFAKFFYNLYYLIHTQQIDEETTIYDSELHELQAQISAIDQKISALLIDQHTFYNPKWERVFRAGAEESYFAYQVDRYACIYMEKLSDLFEHSPLTYFRANRRLLAHDIEG